jgi:prolipoprotein diacylglyceryltransferase
LNGLLDRLPRPRVFSRAAQTPAFHAMGIAGFYAALLAACAGALATGRSLVVTVGLAAVCAVSFYAYALARRRFTRRESLVLLEHVWFAFACCTAALWALRVPVLPYLDIVATAMPFFLASGRVGCAMSGCCHGYPSSVGIVYKGDSAGRDFAFSGVRLFPVPLLECAGLVCLGVSGFAALRSAPEGRVLAWYLLGYAILRFGLEGLRGDARPHWLGLSQARWMALAQAGFALRLTDAHARPAIWIASVVVSAAAIVVRWRRASRTRLLAAPHIQEIRERLQKFVHALPGQSPLLPEFYESAAGARLGISWAGASLPGAAHLSLSLGPEKHDVPLLCSLAARAFPALMVHSARLTSARVLQFAVPAIVPERKRRNQECDSLARRIHGQLFREAEPDHGAAEAPPLRARAAAQPWFFRTPNGG